MILDFGGGFALRQATADDHAAFCRVCLETGDGGRDATWREDDPDLLGLVFAVPYQALEPGNAFAIEGPDGVVGYLFGVLDTLSFNGRLARSWYPRLRRRASDPGPDPARWKGSDWLRRMVHTQEFGLPKPLLPYPSHGHIDLLPPARGRGIGSRAMVFLERRLLAEGSTGIHLHVDPRNTGALTFYSKLGFEVLRDPDLPDHTAFAAKRLG